MPTDATDASAALKAAKDAVKAAWGPVQGDWVKLEVT
jgi:hypothetical protein